MITIYDATKPVADYCEKFLKGHIQYDVREHDNCLYNIRFYEYPTITPVKDALRISFHTKSFLINNIEYSRLEIE